jgi:hypothetical protein
VTDDVAPSADNDAPIRQGDTRACGIQTPHETHIWVWRTFPIVCNGDGHTRVTPPEVRNT